MNKIRIFLTDDHAVLRAGLSALLRAEPDMEVVGEAGDGEEALNKIRELNPDIVLLDITMPKMGGLEVAAKLNTEGHQAKIIILTVHDDEGYLHQALSHGAVGYVPKKAADTELMSAIRAAQRGEIFIHSSMTMPLIAGIKDSSMAKKSPDKASLLSDRELEVLCLIARGYTNQQVADRLFIGLKTVETYKSRLIEKLKLKGRAELVRYAMEQGLLNTEI